MRQPGYNGLARRFGVAGSLTEGKEALRSWSARNKNAGRAMYDDEEMPGGDCLRDTRGRSCGDTEKSTSDRCSRHLMFYRVHIESWRLL